jgi:hypothetical protein
LPFKLLRLCAADSASPGEIRFDDFAGLLLENLLDFLDLFQATRVPRTEEFVDIRSSIFVD